MTGCYKKNNWIFSQVEDDRKHTSGEENMRQKGCSNILKSQIFFKEIIQ